MSKIIKEYRLLDSEGDLVTIKVAHNICRCSTQGCYNSVIEYEDVVEGYTEEVSYLLARTLESAIDGELKIKSLQ